MTGNRHRPRRCATVTTLIVLPLLLGGCGGNDGTRAAPDEPSESATEAISPSQQRSAFPTAGFAAIADHPVTDARAAELQTILTEAANRHGVGVTATVMSPSGTWTGAVGRADRQHRLRPDAQMAIGSITKSIIAAQVMQLVESGELSLDDPVADYLPPSFDLDTNEATVRHLLAMRSGIPEHVDQIWDSLSTDRRRRWTPMDLLALVLPPRAQSCFACAPPGGSFEYSSTNYLLLGLVIEHVRGRPLAEVLRAGVLAGGGLDRLVFQPAERPSQPMAMPFGENAALQKGGGFLPSLAAVSAAGPAGAMASDSASLARWWARFCGGQIVSQASLDEMTAFLAAGDRYGMGLMDEDAEGTTVGHEGIQVGFAARATCLLKDGLVITVLTNHEEGLIEADVTDALAAAVAEWD